MTQYCYEFYVPTKKKENGKLINIDLSPINKIFEKTFSSYSIRSETGVYDGKSFETLIYYVYTDEELNKEFVKNIINIIKKDLEQETALVTKKEIEFLIM